jgi:hypothetical protein
VVDPAGFYTTPWDVNGQPPPLLSTRTVLSFATTDNVQNAWDPTERHPCADPVRQNIQQEPAVLSHRP